MERRGRFVDGRILEVVREVEDHETSVFWKLSVACLTDAVVDFPGTSPAIFNP